MPSPIIRHRRHQTGSLLITAAVAAAIIAILIGGMLTYISNEFRLNVRSHKWTQALNLAEAGVDMAFTEFNNYYMVDSTTAFSTTRGWYSLGGGSYYRYVSSYTDAAGKVVGNVYSRVDNVSGLHPSIFAYGGCSGVPSGIVYRAVTSVLSSSGRFPAGMVAKNKIDMNGNNVSTDSYDSTDVSKSTNSKYDAAKRQANGDIASNDSITNTLDVSLGNANIYGSVLTSPSGSVTMGPSGSIGPTFVSGSRATTVAAAKSAGWLRNDFQVDIPDVTLPSGATSWTSAGGIGGTTTLGAGTFQSSGIDIKNSETLTINGTVNLYVTGDIKMAGNSQIILTTGSKLTVYAAGSVSIAGNGVANGISTDSNSDMALQFYGLKTSTSWTISGNGIWNGLVYAPYAAVTLNGGGANGDMSGAVVANSITMNGHVQFHYDEALRKTGPNASFDIASWQSFRWDPVHTKWIADN